MISELAYVHPAAKLGADVTVEPFAYIAGDVVIGDGCWIGPHAAIMNGVRMGRGNKIHPHATVGDVPQDLKFKGEDTLVEMGDNNNVREGATIHRGTASKGKTVVGSNNLIMACAHIAHDCKVGNNCVIANNVLLAGEVELGDFVIMGGASAVHQFCRIGDHAIVSGGTMVGKDIVPFTTAARNPVTFVGANLIGLRRRGFTNEQIDAIRETFRILFQEGRTYGKAVEVIEEELPSSPERDKILDFVRTSKRGIMKPFNSKIAELESENA